MSVDLTGLPLAASSPRLIEFGGLLTPVMGGAVQKLTRLGTRWGWSFESASMAINPTGRSWSAAFAAAKREGAIVALPQPDLDLTGAAPNGSIAAATASGRVIPLAGLAANQTIITGQWLSFVHGGRRYIDQVTVGAVASNAGTATVTVQNLLRVALSQGDLVEIARPKIEGWIDGLAEWPQTLDRTTSFQFAIMEAR